MYNVPKNISNPLIRTLTWLYQRVRNVSFSENFACFLNGFLLNMMMKNNRSEKTMENLRRGMFLEAIQNFEMVT